MFLLRAASICPSAIKKFPSGLRCLQIASRASCWSSSVPLRSVSPSAVSSYTSRQPLSHTLSPLYCHTQNSPTSSSSSKMAVPPEQASGAVHLHWNDITVETIDAVKTDVISMATKMVDEISAIPVEAVTFENTMQVLENMHRELSEQGSLVDFPSMVYTDKAIRDASTAADKELSQFMVELRCNKSLFDRVVAVKEKFYDSVDTQGKRLLDHFIRDGRRLALHLSEETRLQIKEVDQELTKLSIDFQRNLAEESTKLTFTREELDGMPDDFITSLEKDDEKFVVTLKYPHTIPIAKKARCAETRRRVNVAFNSRCMAENTEILEKMLELRRKKASLLSYPTFADYILEIRMARSSKEASEFLRTLSDRVTPLAEKELAKLKQYKEAECKELGVPYDGKLNAWDVNYYKTQVETKEYSIDQELYKVYFPMEKVTQGLLAIYQDLLGIVFTKVDDADVWHPDVTMYRVTEKTNGWILGYFYLDLYPRDGKFGHAACFPLQPGTRLPNGERQVAVVAVVCNFTKPTENKPSLLLHSEVETFFHEFGHAMHGLCATDVLYSRFSGTRVERDFVEAPSQMLENWCWQREPLQRMSGHFETGEPLPNDMIETLAAARNANVGIDTKRQLCFGLFDQHIHTCEDKVCTRTAYNKFCMELNRYPPAEGTNMPATFGHIAGGYEAQYYGYMWSNVFSYDMFFSRFHKEGVMSVEVGKQYREFILQPGGSRDAKDMLHDFLGRHPNQDAFLEQTGISSSA